MIKPVIFHVIVSLNSGGCENNLLRTLPLMGEQTHIVVALKEPGSLAARYKAAGIQVICLNMRKPISISCFRSYYRLVRQNRPAAVISYLTHADLVVRLMHTFIRVPAVSFLRAVPEGSELRAVRVFERLTRFLAHHYFANSQAIRNYYEKYLGVSPKKFTILPNGIDLEDYQGVDRSHFRAEIGADSSTIIFTFVANLHPGKGHTYLLEAYEKICTQIPSSRLVLVGTGSLMGALKGQIAGFKSAQRIEFLGRRADIKGILAASDVFVFPSLHEGMSNALLEAMASRLPIIACDIPENRAILPITAALYVKPRSVEDLSGAMLKIAKDPSLRRALAEGGHREAAERFDIHKTAAMFSQAIERLLVSNKTTD